MKAFGLAILLSIGTLQAEEISTTARGSSQVQVQQQFKKGFYPLKALHRAHESLVNAAIRLSSIGIDQPVDLIDEADLTPLAAPLFSEAKQPACEDLRLTAMVVR